MSDPDVSGTILVVDDTPTNLGSVVETLSRAGYRVRLATEGGSALEQQLAEAERLRSRLQEENRYLRQEIIENGQPGEIVGSSPAMQAALRKVSLVAGTDTTVLIRGETGTGKELIARALHENSRRRDRPFVKLNCSAIPPSLVESELFGHGKSAFTGKDERRLGRFELADGGTLFLDEVSELPPETQTKLLRVLQEREIEPVGGPKIVKVDVRVVAATNRDLQADSEHGRFRQDLHYRLNVFPIELPPLRERPEDIEPLARYFMTRMARKLGKPLTAIEPATLMKLRAHRWPGNVRDLLNTIERAAVLATDEALVIDWDLEPPRGTTLAGEVLTLEALERAHIITVLRRTHGVIEGPKGAAKLLNLKPSTARFRMKKLGIARADFAL